VALNNGVRTRQVGAGSSVVPTFRWTLNNAGAPVRWAPDLR